MDCLFSAHSLWNFLPLRSSDLISFLHSPQNRGCRSKRRCRALSMHTRQETKPVAALRLHWRQIPSFLRRSWYPLVLFCAHALWNLIPSRSCRSSSVTIFSHSPQIIGCRFIHRSLIFPRHTEQKSLPFWAFRLPSLPI